MHYICCVLVLSYTAHILLFFRGILSGEGYTACSVWRRKLGTGCSTEKWTFRLEMFWDLPQFCEVVTGPWQMWPMFGGVSRLVSDYDCTGGKGNIRCVVANIRDGLSAATGACVWCFLGLPTFSQTNVEWKIYDIWFIWFDRFKQHIINVII